MSDRERTDAGTFAETVTLDDVLGVFEGVRGPVITSSDVAEQLDCTTEAARQKLARLYNRGDVDRRKTGRTVVWWLDDPSTPARRPDETTGEQGEVGEADLSATDGSPEGDERGSDESTSDGPTLDRSLVETVRREL